MANDTITIDITETGDTITVETTTVAGSFTMANIDHTLIQNIGTNTHAQIDTAIDTTLPNKVDKLTQEVIVTSVSDLPTASGGFHTLADNTLYNCKAPSGIALGTNAIKFGANSHIFADVPAFGAFFYTGTGTVFNNNTNDLDISGIVLIASTGTFINFDGQTKTKLSVVKNVSIFAQTLGTITDADISFFNDFLFSGFTDGFTVTGTNTSISFSTGRFSNYTNTAIDFGTSVTEDIRLSQPTFVEGAVGSFSISGAASSANVGNRALVDAGIFNGDGDALQTIDHCDLKWEFKSNTGKPEISDSMASATSYIADGDEATTTISGGSGDLGNPIVISGTWTESGVCRFTTDAAGKLTYVGLENATVFVTSKLEFAPVSGTNVEYWFHIRKNGTTVDLVSRDLALADANSPRKIILQTEIEFTTNDYVEVVVENRTNTTNVEIDAVNFIIG